MVDLMVPVRAVALVLLAAAGCDQLFGLTVIGPPASAPGDGASVGDGMTAGDGVLAAFPNLVFVSSGKFQFPWAVPSNADAACSTAAHNAGLLGSYVAWLSSPAGSIADRLRSLPFARGWRRPDGMPFADTVNDIITGNILSAPRLDENNQDAVLAEPTIQVATGTMADGTYVPGRDAACGAGNIEVGTPASAPAAAWTDAGYVPCNNRVLRMYCFSFGAQ
jgi:hypothetical protein